MTDSPQFPYVCYLATPAEIIATSPTCYEVYWECEWVAEFSNQLSAEQYLLAEFCESL